MILGLQLEPTKVLRTVSQYSYFPVISGCVFIKQSFLLQEDLQFPLPHLLNVETPEKLCIHGSTFLCGLEDGLGMCSSRTRHKCKFFPRLCSTIAVKKDFGNYFRFLQALDFK